jgi:hypothetical protein
VLWFFLHIRFATIHVVKFNPALVPLCYKIDKERKLVMSTGSGVVTMAESLAHQDNLLKDPDFAPSFSQLMDLTHVTELQLGTEDVRRIAQRPIFSGDSRRAIVASRDVVFGVLRMFEIFREHLGETGIRVFRNLDEALAWVLAKNSGA